jgi:FtsH-binding integral membrane protein
MELVKTALLRIASFGLVGGVVVATIAWWRMDPVEQEEILGRIGRMISWAVLVLILPWATWFLTRWAARKDTNAAGAMLVLSYTLVEAVLLGWLFDFSLNGAAAWTAFVAAVLVAGFYNVLICDWIAERIE